VRLLKAIDRNVPAVDPMGARCGEEHNHIRHRLRDAEKP
jgi:hypothetical protein